MGSTHIHVDHNTQRDPIQASSSTFTLVSSDTCIHSTYLHQFFKMPPKSTTTKPKAASEHASYQDMITDAIVNLKDRNGSSRIALKKYVRANNKINAADAMFDSLFNRALKAGVEKGVFAQPKGSSGGTKLAKKEPKPAAAKAAPKPKAEKKTTDKKPAVKKATTTKKPAAAKTAKPKAAPKPKAPKKEKAEAKPKVAKPKAAAKPNKDAPAVVDKPAVLGKTKSGRVTKTTPKTPAAKKAAPKKKATPKKA